MNVKSISSVFFVPLWFCLMASLLSAAEPGDADLKASAYEAMQQNRTAEAANQFQKYFEKHPEDARAAMDYANLLVQLNRPADAVKVLEVLHQKHPEHEAAYFRLGELQVQLKRLAEAEKIFQSLEKSSNPDMAAAAKEARRRLRGQMARESRAEAEQRVYDLAGQFKYREALDLLTSLESQGPPLSFALEMQRLYCMQALGEYAPALKHADLLAETHPNATDLALLRADLLAQLGRRLEAEALWRRIQKENAGTSAGLIAGARLENRARPEEDLIFDLARQRKYREALAAIDKLEQQDGKLSWAMQLQRLYAWQGLGETERALEQVRTLAQTHPGSNELALFQADLLIARHEWEEASKILIQLKERQPDTPVAEQAASRLDSIPPIANLNKWYWGEAYEAGEYLGRFGSVVGSGFARHGWFVPKARWLQPYVETRFSVDTRSSAGRERTIITDNFLAFSGGVRAQVFPTEYLFFYVSGGMNKDFLNRRDNGDWALDWQGGVYGFKSWGPGTVLFTRAPGEVISATGNMPATTGLSAANGSSNRLAAIEEKKLFFWRGDWFVDAGADFSYYHRYDSWLGYGQAHEGFRLFQIGPRAAVDAYAVENVSWDVRGNYFDNVFEVGPGARVLWRPGKRWEVVLRGEWLNGFYFGRDALHNRGGDSGHYDEFRAALTVGVRW